MITITAFDNSWYASWLDQHTPDTGNGRVDAHCRSRLAAACVLAQSIDGLAAAIKEATGGCTLETKRRRE